MNIKEAKKIIVSLSKPEKMPGFAYGIPAAECKTGSKLRLIPNSVCSDCYALKNNYTRFPAIIQAQYKRLESIQDARWVEAMAVVINSQAVSKHKVFRWHDSGDVQDLQHLEKIFEVCRLTPGTRHWMPTREASILQQVKPEEVPKNLIIRMSSHMIDQGPVKFWPWTSTVTSKGGASCPAPNQNNNCGDCRQCWNRKVENVSYGKH
jgi:hypothetical protein